MVNDFVRSGITEALDSEPLDKLDIEITNYHNESSGSELKAIWKVMMRVKILGCSITNVK